MRGDIIRKTLSSIGRIGISIGDLVAIILSEGYGASYSQLQKAADKREAARNTSKLAANLGRKYSALIYKLKKDGLIMKKSDKVYLTGKGEVKLGGLNKKYLKKKFKPEPANNFTIVVYDVPKKKGNKRRWLRESLTNLGLKMIQRSVFLGKVKLPEDFLNDIKDLDLFDCVEIFEITKSGTLREL